MNAASHTDLCLWNAALLAQWRVLAQAFERPCHPTSFAQLVGPHLRHVLEHHEALLWPALPGVVRYDERPRDAEVERQPAFAVRRLARVEALLRQPQRLPASDAPIAVEMRVGLQGERNAHLASTFGRELAMVGSHAVHHLALVVPHCQAHAIPLPTDAGRAPATVAHARANLQPLQETP